MNYEAINKKEKEIRESKWTLLFLFLRIMKGVNKNESCTF